MAAKRRYWLVYRREIIEEYGETSAGPWQWQGKTVAVVSSILFMVPFLFCFPVAALASTS